MLIIGDGEIFFEITDKDNNFSKCLEIINLNLLPQIEKKEIIDISKENIFSFDATEEFDKSYWDMVYAEINQDYTKNIKLFKNIVKYVKNNHPNYSFYEICVYYRLFTNNNVEYHTCNCNNNKYTVKIYIKGEHDG